MRETMKVSTLAIGSLLLSALAMLGAPAFTTGESMTQKTVGDDVEEWMKQLSSSDESERLDGLAKLKNSRQASIQIVLAHLADLLNDPRPRFATGREEEGARVLAEAIQETRKLGNEELREHGHVWQKVSVIAINARLMTDLVSLLGGVGAVEAIPLLIEIMVNNPPMSYPWASPEIDALAAIGKQAVPILIRHLQDSAFQNYNFRRVVYGWSIRIDGYGVMSDARSAYTAETERKGLKIKRRIDAVKPMVAQALGVIGDPEALPALKRVLQVSRSSMLGSAASAAIGAIEAWSPPSQGWIPARSNRRP